MLNTQYQEISTSAADTIDQTRQSSVLAVSFARECGFRPLPWMQRGFLRLLDEGFEYDMLLCVIDQTSHAPRPSWAYLEAIIRRARLNGRYTYLDFLSMPRRDQDKKYREAHMMDNIPEDIIDEAIRNFDGR